MIDKQKIVNLFNELDTYLREVKQLALLSDKEYLSDTRNADTFRILHSNQIISESLLEKLLLMTRFRNRIVHLYWDIDDKLVLEIMKNNYKDFINYRTEILNYLKKTKN